MAFWSSEMLCRRLPELIAPYNAARIACAAYELSLGREVALSGESDRATLTSGQDVRIAPGQFALLMTAETVSVPADAIGLISIKFKLKLPGLLNVSGFHVDPGFKGPLKFSVYNAGAREIHLREGEPTFLIWYADLDQPTGDLYKKVPPANITTDDLKHFEDDSVSPASLDKRLDVLESRLRVTIAIGVVLVTALLLPLYREMLVDAYKGIGWLAHRTGLSSGDDGGAAREAETHGKELDRDDGSVSNAAGRADGAADSTLEKKASGDSSRQEPTP